ncbi:MAG: DNA polymerase I [Flavobacteriales bacterium]|nr:DNA polymerase I [Flavobacteriales bacterium]
MSEKKLFLLDAFALIYRSYFGFGNNQRYNSKGVNTSAALGFTNTLLEVLRKEDPSHIGVVFDAPSSTAIRTAQFSEYKANREEMPEDIKKSIPIIQDIVKAFNIPILMAEGYEADDVIGTLAKQAEKAGFTTYMMTPDKDFGQLVSENIFMYRPGRSGKPSEIWGVPEVCEKFEVENPLQVIDILGLWGDAVDNIPGIPGIGEKTAKKLIKLYGSVEGLIENVEDLKGKQKENVINFAEQGKLSKVLATILLDAPVEFKPEDLVREEPNKEDVRRIFSELEFRTLAKRILGDEVPLASNASGQLDLFGGGGTPAPISDDTENKVVELKKFDATKVDYRLVQEGEVDQLVKELSNVSSFCFDTETTGVDEIMAEIVGLAISFKKETGYYIPMPNDFDAAKKVLHKFKPVFENDKIEKIAQNLKYDITILKRYDVQVRGPIFDTMLAHYLLQPDMKHSMDRLSEAYLAYKPISIETLIGKKGKKQLSMRDVSLESVKNYASEDADITLQLKEVFEPEITKSFKKLFEEVEMPLTDVLSDIELEGINLDVPSLRNFSAELGSDIDRLEKEIIELAGTDFNVDSPRQLGQIIYEILQIGGKPKKTKTGQYSTSEDVLIKMSNEHAIIPKILDYRSLRKLKSTYVDALPDLVNPETGRLHTSYMQAIAATGRLSSNNPNLQNIPIRTEKGREIRKAFIPRNDDYKLLSADYSQIELRIAAAFSEDQTMIDAFQNNLDIHASTAAKVFGVPIDEVDREMRSKAKAVNFGILYGQTAFGLAQNLNIPRKEAKEIIESYFKEFYKISVYINDQINNAREKGYVETIMGRKRILKDINSRNAVVRGHAERNAINAPIQGSAADIIKVAMINIHKKIKANNFKSRMLLQVHDELVFDLFKPEEEEFKQMVIREMQEAVTLKVPLTVEAGTGNNWLEAH